MFNKGSNVSFLSQHFQRIITWVINIEIYNYRVVIGYELINQSGVGVRYIILQVSPKTQNSGGVETRRCEFDSRSRQRVFVVPIAVLDQLRIIIILI